MEELRFDYLCGKCFAPASRSGRPGKVLSCCDFLCYDCGIGIQEPFTCPSCRKQNVKFVSTDDPSIPAEVVRNISDPEQCVDQLKSVLLFQIKHYKTMLHRAVGKMMRDKKEFHRRLSLIEGGQQGGGQQGRFQQSNENNENQRPSTPGYQSRPQQPAEMDSEVRPRKMLRPSTASGVATSSSSSGIWRTGTAPSGSRNDAGGPQGQQGRQGQRQQQQGGMMRRPMTATGRPGEGGNQLLSSILSENESDTSTATQPSRYRGGDQNPDPHQRPFNTPAVIGRTPSFTPQTLNPPSSPLGMQRAMNGGGTQDRPLTPSTLFLPNNQQSHHFQNRQQQAPQQQMRPGGPPIGPPGGPGRGSGQGQGPFSQQNYPPRPSTTSTPLSRLRSPHSNLPSSLPRTPSTIASGTVAVTVSQNRSSG